MEYALQSESVKKKINRILDKQGKMSSERSNFESNWQECMDYIVPRKGDVISSRAPGDKRGNDLFDTTAIMANQLLAGALHGMLTNPSQRFFDLIPSDPELEGDEEVQFWLHKVADDIFIVMNNSNFQTEVHEIYLDIGAIGTACMFTGEHDENIVHFAARPMKEIFIDEDNLGRICTVHREFSWKPRQIIQEFGEKNVPEYVLKKYKEGCEEDWPIIHATYPHDDNRPFLKFDSCYILKEQKLEIASKGFPEMPFAVPRWTKTSGEKYGRGPGMQMLPDIKMINKMMETTIQGAQLTIRPPYAVQDDGVIGRLKLTPAGVTVVRAGVQEPIRQLLTDARIDFGFQFVDYVRRSIRSGFYVDQLQLNEGPQMTATEVMQRTEEKLRLMGPVLGRQHYEFLRPVIERVYRIMERKKKIPPIPAKLKEKGFDVRYSSLVARAQRMSEGQNLARAISVAAPIVNADPKALDNLNTDEAFRYILGIYGVPPKIFNTKRAIKDIRDARAEAQAQIAKEQQAQHQADLAAKVGPAVAQVEQARNQ